MHHVWAKFDLLPGTPPVVYLRKETRLYYHPTGPKEPSNSVCVGSVVMCNPSTPKKRPTVGIREPISDNTLTKVTNIFRAAGAYKSPTIPFQKISKNHFPYDPNFRPLENPYLAVLNLFYVADKNPDTAANWLKSPGASYSEELLSTCKFIWCAWGVNPPIVANPICNSVPCFGLNKSSTPSIGPVPPINPYHPRLYFYPEMTAVAKVIARYL